MKWMLMMSDAKQKSWRQKQGSDCGRTRVGCSEEMKCRGVVDKYKA